MSVVHFNMVVEINQLLKRQGIEYSLHALGGCTCVGLTLRQDGKAFPLEKIIELINCYLKDQWMKVRQDEDNEYLLHIESKFDFERSSS